MPTMQEVTLGHSRRLSAIHRRRNDDLDAAARRRDVVLRELPTAARAYDVYDRATLLAQTQARATESRVLAVHQGEIDEAEEARSTALGEAAASRKADQLSALAERVEAEAVAERRYRDDVSPLGSEGLLADRQQRVAEAERVRKADREKARAVFDKATAEAQSDYRRRVDDALASERQAVRDAERGHTGALRLAEVARTSAIDRAELTLYQALSAIADARDVLRAYRQEIAGIARDSRQDEQGEFERFRQELAGRATDIF